MSKRNFTNYLNFTLVFAILLFLVLACDGIAHSQGKILDEQGNPIEGARVFLDVDNEKYKFESNSKEDGSYSLGGTVAPFKLKVRLIIVKSGYQTSLETFDSQEELKGEHNVVLKKN
jgi:hypothetical protein